MRRRFAAAPARGRRPLVPRMGNALEPAHGRPLAKHLCEPCNGSTAQLDALATHPGTLAD